MPSLRTTLISTLLTLAAAPAAGPANAQAAAPSDAGRQPVLLISIDGLRPAVVLDADRHGQKIPVLRSFVRDGSYAREVINVNPTVTNPNHTTLVTGVLPAEHGIYNNRPFAPSKAGGEGYRAYGQIKAPTLWGAAKAAGLTTASLFWPVTDGAKDIDFNPKDGSDDDNAKIANDAVNLIEHQRPELLTIHFVALDHQTHAHGPDSSEAKAALEDIDTAVGRVVAAERKAFPNAVIAIVSDHGFSPLSQQINLNVALAQAGFIKLGDGENPPVVSWTGFAWYVGGMAMIVQRDPNDGQTRAGLARLLRTLAADPANGIDQVYDASQLADQGLAPQAQFVVALKPGYRMGTPLRGPLLTRASGGGHGAFSTRTVRPDMHASFFVTGPGIAAGKDLGLVDMRRIAPTLAENLKVSLPSAALPVLPLGR